MSQMWQQGEMTRSIPGVTFPFHFEQEKGGKKIIMSGATFVTGQWFVIVFMFLNPSVRFSLFVLKGTKKSFDFVSYICSECHPTLLSNFGWITLGKIQTY